jgi:secreted PhoX family phosphatase
MQKWLKFTPFLLSLMGCSSILPHDKSSAAMIHSTASGWAVRPLISVGQSANNGYRMTGIPDGMGAFDNGDGTFTLLVNHEIAADKGKVVTHGAKGAFVSSWRIDVETLQPLSGHDLIKTVHLWDAKTKQHQPAKNVAFNRLCSADLAKKGTFYDAATGVGYQDYLFLNGEEDKTSGRAFAHTLAGDSYELADLGKIQWENVVANPALKNQTLVIGMDDNHDQGLVLVYIGQKRKQGNPAELAGLVGGQLYAVKVDAKRFSLVALEKVNSMNIGTFRNHALAQGATLFSRPEDGAWNTLDYSQFYFATTDKIGGNPQLLSLQFDDIQQPELGGTYSVVVNGKDISAQMFDNITVDGDGHVLLEEDPGNDARLAAIWRYMPQSKKIEKIFESNPDFFKVGEKKVFNH